MITDPAIQSVRVAVALCDRFAELLIGPSHVTARKQQGALLGFSGNRDELSLRIGEAQQLYPEIWRHLDEARTAFATRGIDVTAYDGLRDVEGVGLGAAVDVESAKHGVGENAVREVVKRANFNKAGLARARGACEALMKATPEIDWAALAKAEANDPEAAAFARATQTRRMMRFGILGLALATPFIVILYLQHHERAEHEARVERAVVAVTPLGDSDRAELAAAVAKRRAKIAAARAYWATAATPAGLKAIVPGARPCRIPVHEPPAEAADAYIRTGDIDAKAFDSSAFESYEEGTTNEPLPDGELRQDDALLADLEQRLSTGTATGADRELLTDIIPSTTFVIIDTDTEAEVTQTAPRMTYTPGTVTGRAYVFSLDDAKFVCAANVAASNTPSEQAPKFLDGIGRAPQAREILHRELEVQLRRALASGLRATGD
jgi:hypothetical protein